jgi:hypothetical protein
MPMLGLIIVYDQASVNDARDPTGQRQQEAQDKTEEAAGHENGNRRKSYAKKVAQGLQGKWQVVGDK